MRHDPSVRQSVLGMLLPNKSRCTFHKFLKSVTEYRYTVPICTLGPERRRKKIKSLSDATREYRIEWGVIAIHDDIAPYEANQHSLRRSGFESSKNNGA